MYCILKYGVEGEKSDLFTGVLFNNYGPPPGFCFDVLCADEPIIDDKWSPDNNVNRRVSLDVVVTESGNVNKSLQMEISRSTNSLNMLLNKCYFIVQITSY